MKIITTVGTSIFENYQLFNENDKDFKEIYKHFKDNSDEFLKLHTGDSEYNEDIEYMSGRIINWAKENRDAAAEITSIFAIAKQGKENQSIQVHLATTDTVLSVVAAQLIKSWFDEFKSNIKIHFETPKKLETQNDSDYVIHKLRISSNEDFQEGFMNLIEVVSKLINDGKKANENVILNITGGYKPIVPILTLLGQIKDVPLKYIYEESDANEKTALVEIDKLPFNFDWKLGELYLDDLFSDGLKQIAKKPKTLHLLRKELKLINANTYKLTPLGKLFTTSLQELLDSKKSTLGYLVELKVFEFFVQKKANVIRGKSIWWLKNDRSIFFENPQYNQDDKFEQKIDIDIFIEQGEKEIWREVKACSSSGLKKARKQLVTMLDFTSQTAYHNLKEIGLILYKLETTDFAFYKKQIAGIVGLFRGKSIDFTLHLVNIPVSPKGIFNTKRFFEQEIEICQQNI